MDAATELRVAKAASDAGFDLAAGGADATGWLRRGAPDRRVALWIAAHPAALVVALDEARLLDALDPHGTPWVPSVALPPGAVGARAVPAGDFAALTALLRRLDQLAAVLPPSPLRAFDRALETAPWLPDPVTGATETEAVRRVRLKQDVFRKSLLQFWDGRCAITGLAVPALLRASHAKPWADCTTDAERLDVHNGLLLAAHLDAAFDEGLITVQDDGLVVSGPMLDHDTRALLGLARTVRVKGLRNEHHPYLAWHRSHVFQPGVR